MVVWIIMECQNRTCESRFNPLRERPSRRSGRWPLRDTEAQDRRNMDHRCPSCDEPGKAIRRVDTQLQRVRAKAS